MRAVAATAAGEEEIAAAMERALEEGRDYDERLTELAVNVSLMGVGLKIDQAPGWRAWQPTWRLLGITKPLCIGALAMAGVALAIARRPRLAGTSSATTSS